MTSYDRKALHASFRHSTFGPRQFSSLRSSKAEPSVDNGQTEARYLAEGPFHFHSAGWLRQMSGGLKNRRDGCDTRSSGQFCPPFVVSSVSTRPCEGRGAGANPAKGTISFMRKAKRPATALQPQATRCKSEAHVHFSPRRLAQTGRRPFKPRTRERSPSRWPLHRTTSIEVMQRAFNTQSRERYPGGPPFIKHAAVRSELLRNSIVEYWLQAKCCGCDSRRARKRIIPPISFLRVPFLPGQ